MRKIVTILSNCRRIQKKPDLQLHVCWNSKKIKLRRTYGQLHRLEKLKTISTNSANRLAGRRVAKRREAWQKVPSFYLFPKSEIKGYQYLECLGMLATASFLSISASQRPARKLWGTVRKSEVHFNNWKGPAVGFQLIKYILRSSRLYWRYRRKFS